MLKISCRRLKLNFGLIIIGRWECTIDIHIHFDTLKDFTDFDQIKSTDMVTCQIDWLLWFCSFKLNVIEQLKLKIANLTSIDFCFPLLYNSYQDDKATNEINTTIIRCVGKHSEALKYFLIDIFPNIKYLMLYYAHPLGVYHLFENMMTIFVKNGCYPSICIHPYPESNMLKSNLFYGRRMI